VETKRIAISRDPSTPEKLFIYGVSNGTPTLAVADPVALVPTAVGPVKTKPQLFPSDMQGDALGHLFVLGEQGHFLELDSKSAAVLHDVQTSFSAGDWAVMTYGNRIFFFGDGNVSLEDVATDNAHAARQHRRLRGRRERRAVHAVIGTLLDERGAQPVYACRLNVGEHLLSGSFDTKPLGLKLYTPHDGVPPSASFARPMMKPVVSTSGVFGMKPASAPSVVVVVSQRRQ